MITCRAKIEHRIEIGGLSRGGEHACYTTFECCDFCSHCIVGRVLQTGVKIAALFEIEQFGHLITGFVFESGTLINGKYTRLSFFGGPPCLYAEGRRFHFCTHCDTVLC